MISPYLRLMRLHKPIGIGLLLWPTLWALWIAGQGRPNPYIVVIFVLGVIIMRSAGCIINDFADRNFDKEVARTKNRPLATKQISPQSALVLFSILSLCALVLVLQLNRLTLFLALIGFLLTLIYPLMKRWTHWPQFFLGITFAWGIPMAFTALKNTLPPIAGLLFISTLLWIMAYDTEYAMADKVDDLQIGVKSTAVLWGKFDKLIILVLQLMVLLLLVGVGYILSFKPIYYFSLLIVLFLFFYQQFLIKNRNPHACIKAFANNNSVGMVIFLGLILSYWPSFPY